MFSTSLTSWAPPISNYSRSVRYSKPELQTHITYLYGMTNNSDQKTGQDAIERYAAARKQLDTRIAELNGMLGFVQ